MQQKDNPITRDYKWKKFTFTYFYENTMACFKQLKMGKKSFKQQKQTSGRENSIKNLMIAL